MNPLLDSAIEYAARGWPVVALWWPQDGRCACPKGDRCPSPAKHPLTPHGLDDATTNTETIRALWTRWPHANVGLRTGIAFDVLDIDGDEGLDALSSAGLSDEILSAAKLAVAITDGSAWTLSSWDGPEVVTSKGFHRYLLPTGLGNRAGMVTKVDYRGKGGYVVAPPSRHVSGHTYAWGIDGCAVELEHAPKWLVDLAAGLKTEPVRPPTSIASRPNTSSVAGIIAKMATAPQGQRNSVLNWAAHTIGGHYRAGRLTRDKAVNALEQLHTVAQRAGLSITEIERTIRSGFKAGSDGIAA